MRGAARTARRADPPLPRARERERERETFRRFHVFDLLLESLIGKVKGAFSEYRRWRGGG